MWVIQMDKPIIAKARKFLSQRICPLGYFAEQRRGNSTYPGAAPKEATPGSITIANGKTQMDFAGNVFHNPEVEMPTDLPFFNQAELGHPELDKDKWGALENRVFDLLDSGRPLTISAEGKSYVLPAVKVPRWRARFQKIC
jgi:hypothetical protein